MRKRLLDSLPDFISDDGQIVTNNFKFELITPMLGGDSKSWELNLEAPVRAQSIKGQLRFWWRTMQNKTDPSKLLELENYLWGGKSGKDADGNDIRRKSKVQIAVLKQKVISTHTAEMLNKHTLAEGPIPTYIAFPIRDLVKKGQEIKYITNASFTLRVSFHKDDENIVLKTLKLWTLFGGVGARTRRGCGSLYCEELLRDFNDAADIKKFIEMVGDAQPLNYCRLAGATLAVVETRLGGDHAADAWRGLVDKYNGFRQCRNGKSGRSFWPEPDAIRKLTGRLSSMHGPEHPDDVWFPRAAYGLPIITQFKTDGNGRGDPADVQLAPRDGSRWPSPVIIKVIKLSSCVLKVSLVLNQRFPETLELVYSKKQDRESLPPIKSVPSTAHPDNTSGKVMRTNDHLVDDSVYKALFKELGVNTI